MLKEEILNDLWKKEWENDLRFWKHLGRSLGTPFEVLKNKESEYRNKWKSFIGVYTDLGGGLTGDIGIIIYTEDIIKEINEENAYFAEFNSEGCDSDYHSISIDIPCNGVMLSYRIIKEEDIANIKKYLINKYNEIANDNYAKRYDYNYGSLFNIVIQENIIKIFLKNKHLDDEILIVIEDLKNIINKDKVLKLS